MDLPAEDAAVIYRLCAQLLLCEPTTPLVETLGLPGVRETFEHAAPGAEALLTNWSPEDEEGHATEFAALFLLPGAGAVTPRAGAWLASERDTSGLGVARHAQGMLNALGRTLDPASALGRLPLDHAALLCELAALGFESQPQAGRAFAEQTLDPWAGAFGAALEAKAQSPLYRALGVLLQGLHAQPARALPSAELPTEASS